jgi:trehalose 6-phosphate phosphatase
VTHRDRLARLLAGPRPGLVTDLDGTIAALDGTRPRVSPAIRAALGQLAERLGVVAVITGRRAADAHDLIGVPGIEIVGNHGLERWRDGAVQIAADALAQRPAIERLLADLRALADRYGCEVQDKQVSAVVDHRGSKPGAAEELCACVLDLCGRSGFRALRSRASIEILPPVGIDKGSALRGLVDEFALGGVIYLGDDTSDIDALREVAALRRRGIDAIGLGVLHDESTGAVAEHADLVVDGVHGVEQLLAAIT